MNLLDVIEPKVIKTVTGGVTAGENQIEEVKNMDKRGANASGALAGVVWFIGWLFTIGFANLVWWKIILGIVVWPYFLALAVR